MSFLKAFDCGGLDARPCAADAPLGLVALAFKLPTEALKGPDATNFAFAFAAGAGAGAAVAAAVAGVCATIVVAPDVPTPPSILILAPLGSVETWLNGTAVLVLTTPDPTAATPDDNGAATTAATFPLLAAEALAVSAPTATAVDASPFCGPDVDTCEASLGGFSATMSRMRVARWMSLLASWTISTRTPRAMPFACAVERRVCRAVESEEEAEGALGVPAFGCWGAAALIFFLVLFVDEGRWLQDEDCI